MAKEPGLWETTPDLSKDDSEFVTELTEPVLDYHYVLGLDPGGTTGVAMLRYTENTLPELIYLHQIPDGRAGFYEWFVGSHANDHLTIVSEQWVEHEVKGADREPCYIEGVEYAFWQENVVYQTPDMKSLISDEFLQENNLWTPNKRHQMDALIHALVYLRNNDHRPTQEALSGETDEKIAEKGDAENAQVDDSESEENENGEGQPRGLTDAEREFLEAMMQEAMEAVEAEGSGADAGSEADGGGLGEGYGPSDNYDNQAMDPVKDTKNPKGQRKARDLNGVFAGYETDDGGKSTELFEGKL